MKKLLFIIMLCYTAQVTAQDVRFSANMYTEPQHYLTNNTDALIHWKKSEERFNIGFGIEYQMTIVYFDADVFIFPALRGADYFHAQGTVLGFNYHSKFREFRLKLGLIKPGLVKRNWSYTYPMIGSDIGVEYYFENGFYFGLELAGDWRTDDKFWSPNATGFYQVSAGIKYGFYW